MGFDVARSQGATPTLLTEFDVEAAPGAPRADEPAQPPTTQPPTQPPGDHRSPRVRFANWMERTFGTAYLPLTMGVGGAATGGATYVLIDRLTHVRPLAIAGGVAAAAAGAMVAGALIFSD